MKNLLLILLIVVPTICACSEEDCFDIDLSGMGSGSDCDNETNYPSNIIPTITVSGITNVTFNSATIVGNVISDGGSPILARGAYWNKYNWVNVSTTDHTVDGSGIGEFTSSIHGLTSGVTYYVWLYGTNKNGIYLTSAGSFTTTIP